MIIQGLQAIAPLPGCDWDRLLQLAAEHGVAGVLSRALRSADLPPPVQQQLGAAERTVVQHGLRLTGILGEVTQVLESAGVRLLAYKGPVLSQQLFGEPAIREAVDLDVLISPYDVRGAINALVAKGFTPLRPYPPSAFPQLIRYRAEYGMTRDGVLIELQWRLAPHYFTVPFDFESAWQKREVVTIGGRQVPTLSLEDNLLALCVHGSKHHWERLKWVLDVDVLLRKHPGLHAEAIAAKSAELGLHRMLLASLATCHLLLQTPLPDFWLREIGADPEATQVVREFFDALGDASPQGEAEHHRLMLRLRERMRDRWRYLARLAALPTESEWDLVALPRGLGWGYYALRLSRVAGRALRLLFSR